MSCERRPSFSQTVKEGIGLGIGIRMGGAIADMAGMLLRSAAAWNLLAIAGVMLLAPVALAVAGFALAAAICPFIMVFAVCTMERPNEFIDAIVVPTIVGVIGYVVFGCAALYSWTFKKERAAARARAEAELKPRKQRRTKGRAPVELPMEPNHGLGQALLAIGIILFPAWLVLVCMPRFPRRHRITAAVLLLTSLAMAALLYFTQGAYPEEFAR